MWPSVQLRSTVQVGCSSRSKAVNAVISNGPGRLWHSLIPVAGWWNDTRDRAPPRPRPRPRRPLTPPTRPSPDQGSHRALALARRAWALAAPATFVAVRDRAGGSSWLVGRVGAGGRHDRVPKGCARIGCGRHRVPEGALYDPNYPQRVICPDYLRSVVPVGTMCRCPGADRLPDEDLEPVGHAVDLRPRLSTRQRHRYRRSMAWVTGRSSCRCAADSQPTPTVSPRFPWRTAESLLAVGGLLVDAIFRAVRPWCVRQRIRRGGRLVQAHVGRAALQASESRFWGAMLALIGAIPFVLACVARGQMVLRTLKAPAEAVGYQPWNWPWLAHNVASEAATVAAITATTRRRTGRSADQRRPRATARRVSPITM